MDEWTRVKAIAGINACEFELLEGGDLAISVSASRGVNRIHISPDICRLPRELRYALLAHEAAHIVYGHWQLRMALVQSTYRYEGIMCVFFEMADIGISMIQESNADARALLYLHQLGIADGRAALISALEAIASNLRDDEVKVGVDLRIKTLLAGR